MLEHCDYCGASDFRASHFRSADLPQLILFKLAVRCTTCHERSFVFVPEYFRLRRAHVARRLERSRQSWAR
jgi:hypothetical protein